MKSLELPINSVLPSLMTALSNHSRVVLVAPPGAGKTTGVPLALLDQPWLSGQRILVLEPRRLAARAAASRMAQCLGEALGDTVGVRARLATRISARTRIEVITDGVFTRMVVDDPELAGIGAVLFDEFHERSLDTDLGLALALDAQSGLREDLRILVMSATLDGARVSEILENAPVVESEGRAFTVETRYMGRRRDEPTEGAVADAVLHALRHETGSILAFLPGQREIRRTEERLRNAGLAANIVIAPLYGAMETAAQDRAVLPATDGNRKIVLATAIAESSITIDGVRVVVDAGLARVPRFEPGAGVTRLETVRVSRASADQRRGRAGRTGPGICYRLWNEHETKSLRAFETPEIHAADLSPLVLDCAAWGVADIQGLRWLDPPTGPAIDAARIELHELGALDSDHLITPHGGELRALPLPPRLASMLLRAAALGQAEGAAKIAAILVERGLGGNDSDLAERLRVFAADRRIRAKEMRALASRWARQAVEAAKACGVDKSAGSQRSIAGLLALAFPDRIAKARGAIGTFVLANGRGGSIDPVERLAAQKYIVVAELIGRAAASRIVLAAELDASELDEVAGARTTSGMELEFDQHARSLRARRVTRLGRIVLESSPAAIEPGEQAARALAEGIALLGIRHLPWSKAQSQLRQRLAFLQKAGVDNIPDLSDEQLATTIDIWLGPFLSSKTALADITANDLDQALSALLPWNVRQRLDQETPAHFTSPAGNRHPVVYEGEGAPAISLRVQELFGLQQHPTVADGRLPLTLVLLSPAGRPIQTTRDLPGFWSGSWREVQAEMKGRYPKHPWPDDPANAQPTARTKPRKQ
ncbi:MAG TPA: ATP-dependent helicase HrpB [Hyphomicrobiaceae bacterium]|nr:ATP-dependent helicase HrpB [Hyphomicrobiaceae bacterium]